MDEPTDEDENENQSRRKKKDDSGEGDSDSFGRGKAGAGAGGFKLSANLNNEIIKERRHLTAGTLIEAIVEFFSDWPMRASANLAVTWEKTKTNARSFAIVNWVIEFGEKTVREAALNREKNRTAGRDSRGFQRKKAPAANPNLNLGPTGPTNQ